MTCACCRWRGKPRYGSSANGFRDGWCQPVDNFSRAVRRGDYGKYMTEPFCLEEHASQQTEYVNRVLRPKVTPDERSRAQELTESICGPGRASVYTTNSAATTRITRCQ